MDEMPGMEYSASSPCWHSAVDSEHNQPDNSLRRSSGGSRKHNPKSPTNSVLASGTNHRRQRRSSGRPNRCGSCRSTGGSEQYRCGSNRVCIRHRVTPTSETCCDSSSRTSNSIRWMDDMGHLGGMRIHRELGSQHWKRVLRRAPVRLRHMAPQRRRCIRHNGKSSLTCPTDSSSTTYTCCTRLGRLACMFTQVRSPLTKAQE